MGTKRRGPCTYCKRELEKPTSRSRTAATSDHVMPASVGGQRKVRCCRQCNQLKGDIHPSVWRWFTEHYPAWWKTFQTNSEVVQACAVRWGAMVRACVTGRAPRSDFEEKAHAPLQGP